MADVKISQLPSASTPLAGTEEIPLVQSSTTKKITVSNLLTSANLGTPSAVNLANATNIPMAQASGLLAVNRGGTGTATPNIVAGTNVTVSGTWPNQTINSTFSGAVTSVTGTAPVVSSGGTTPAISMAAATTSVDGYLTSTDWTTFNNKLTSGGALGTPSSGTATNLTGLPLSTGVTGLLPVANGGTGTATPALVAGTNVTITGSWPNQTINATNSGSVTSVSGTGTVNGLTLTGTVTTSGSLTLGGTLDLSSPPAIGGTVAAAITGTTITASTKFVGTNFDAAGSGGGGLRTSSGANCLQWGGGGGVNLTLDGAFNMNPANASISIAPTGTGTLTINPATAGTINNMAIGGTTPAAGAFTTLSATTAIAVTSGGTGQTSYTDGQLLIGNSTGNTLTKATLTAGTNVTITNGNGTITIAASGGGGSGDVVGPASSTDNALARFDTTTGKLLQNSVGILSDTGAISGLTDISASGSVTLSGGTANGVTYLNGSKVLTSGSALVFDGTNLGVGAAPLAWESGRRSLSVSGSTANYFVGANANSTLFGTNFYYSGSASNNLYIANGFANFYLQGSGEHRWYNAPSGTAGNAITFTQAMTLADTGNLGIGTTSPDANFRLDVQAPIGRFKVTSTTGTNSVLIQPNNTGGSLNIGIDSSTGGSLFGLTGYAAGIVHTGAYPLYLGTNNAIRATIDSSGNLGIGTSSPANPTGGKGFEISNASGSSIRATSSGTYLDLQSGGTANYILSNGATPLLFYTNSAERMRLDSSGNLGIGTTAGSGFRLHTNSGATGTMVKFTDGVAQTLVIGTTSTGLHFNNDNGGYQAWQIATSEKMRLDASGNLGIGTTSPNQTGFTAPVLSITNGTSGILELIGTQASDGTVGQIAFYNISATDRIAQILGLRSGANNSGAITFQTNNAGTLAERARIDSSGNFLVGKTASSDTTAGIELRPAGTTYFNRTSSTNADTTLHVYSTGASAYRFYVGMGGTVYATSTTISAISDIRYKENVRDLDVGLNAVMALKPRLYDWKEGKGADIKNARGFIAQEFEEVFPDLIDEWKDPAPEGEEPYKSVRQDLIPVLVKAIQEQNALIQSLKARLDAANL